jgi:hypothetical protein
MPKEADKPTVTRLEKKFAQTAFRVTQERSDFLLPQILDFVQRKSWLNIHPEYQRRLVWDSTKKSLFIESLLLNIPIPPLFLYEWELGRYEVMDGQQRLNAVIEFYENGFALHGLEKWEELNGRRYSELPETLRRGLDRRRLSATVVLFETEVKSKDLQDDIRKIVFERLNTGGQNLNAQEIRNALYTGPFNDLLIRLSEDDLFTRIWEIPGVKEHVGTDNKPDRIRLDNPLYRRMIDSEIVLRFFAFRKRSRIKGAVRRILDNCVKDHRDDKEAQLEILQIDFLERLKVAHSIFGNRTFRYPDQKGYWKLSQPLYDGVLLAVDALWEHRSELKANKKSIRKAVTELFKDETAFAIIVNRPNTARATVKRLELITAAVSRAAKI